MAVSFALDFVEMDILGVPSNYGKRSAYIYLLQYVNNLINGYVWSEEAFSEAKLRR